MSLQIGLRPCPCCGSQRVVLMAHRAGARVECSACRLEGPTGYVVDNKREDAFVNMQQAVQKWNRRPPDGEQNDLGVREDER